MSPRSNPKNPPAASRRKRVLHALYLAQPFLQFIILMVVILVLGRCSPLAPSTNRSQNKTSSDALQTSHPAIDNGQAEEQDIKNAIKDAKVVTDQDELPVISESEYAKMIEGSLDSEDAASREQVRSAFRKHNLSKGRIFSLSLKNEQRRSFFKDRSLRVGLAGVLNGNKTNLEARKAFLSSLRDTKDLQAKAYLIVTDDAMRAVDAVSSIPVHVQTRLAFLSDEKAFLQTTRVDQDLSDSEKELVEYQLAHAVMLAIVLE